MKERGILFSAPMVRAILDGRKTQTRRIVDARGADRVIFTDKGQLVPGKVSDKPWVGWVAEVDALGGKSGLHLPLICPYGQPGDRLWVREAWRVNKVYDPLNAKLIYQALGGDVQGCVHYETDGKPDWTGRYRHSRYMPRWASRITLEIVSVRVERVHEISEADAWAEGCEPGEPTDNGGFFPRWEPHPEGGFVGWDTPQEWFADLWESINGNVSWAANPWVWALEFRKL